MTTDTKVRVVEFVNVGMLHAGEIRRVGEVCDMDEILFQTPEEQNAETGKVYYIEVGSVYDNPLMKQNLNQASRDLFSSSSVLVEPDLSNGGEELFGFEKFDGDASLANMLGAEPVLIEPTISSTDDDDNGEELQKQTEEANARAEAETARANAAEAELAALREQIAAQQEQAQKEAPEPTPDPEPTAKKETPKGGRKGGRKNNKNK